MCEHIYTHMYTGCYTIFEIKWSGRNQGPWMLWELWKLHLLRRKRICNHLVWNRTKNVKRNPRVHSPDVRRSVDGTGECPLSKDFLLILQGIMSLYLVGWFDGCFFNGISSLVGYLMANPTYAYININESGLICLYTVSRLFSRVWTIFSIFWYSLSRTRRRRST